VVFPEPEPPATPITNDAIGSMLPIFGSSMA
jgi:hypothetical protein